MLRTVFIILFLATLAPYVAPRFTESVAFFPLGVQLSYLIGVAPKLLVLFLLGVLFIRLLAIRWYLSILLGASVAVVIAVLPSLFNRVVDRRAANLAAGDQRQFAPPPQMGALAVLHMQEPRCDELCQRLLLNNQVSRFLSVSVSDPVVTLTSRIAATSFKMERRASCPAVDLDRDRAEVQLVDDSADKGGSPAERMRLAIAGGRCLIAEKATLGDADVALFHRNVFNTQSSIIATMFGVDDDVVRGERLSMYQRDGDNFRETYRRTIVRGEKLASISSWISNFSLATFMRRYTQYYYDGPGWTPFLTSMLGFELPSSAKT